MTTEILVCPICKTRLSQSASLSRGGIAAIRCPNCGDYNLAETFHGDFIANNQLQPYQLATLSYAIRRMQGNEQPPLIVQDLVLNILRNTILPAATEQLDNLVLYLGRTLTEPGQKLTLDTGTMRAPLGSKTAEGSAWVIFQAIEAGLMQGAKPPAGAGAHGVPVLNATLSISGWQRFAELQSAVSRSKRAFMAMQYGDAEMDRVFFDWFKPAAKRAGYDLVKLDEEPRAGLIDDRLRLDIRTSRFLIADLSRTNRGAYWEAGYAEGLGRPVIYTCKQSIFDSKDPNIRPHFDTNHYLIVLWDPADLKKSADQLTTTIRVTLPSEAKLLDG